MRNRAYGDELNPRYEQILRDLADHCGIGSDGEDVDEWILDLDDVMTTWQAERDRRRDARMKAA